MLHYGFERSEWQRTRVDNVLCVSEATQGELLRSGLREHVVSTALGWHGNLLLWRLVAPPIHTTRVAVISSVAIVAVEVATKAAWGETNSRGDLQ